MPSREEYLKWADESGFGWSLGLGGMDDAIEALCNRVWNEAMERAARHIEDQSLPDTYSEPCLAIFAEELRNLKQGV